MRADEDTERDQVEDEKAHDNRARYFHIGLTPYELWNKQEQTENQGKGGKE